MAMTDRTTFVIPTDRFLAGVAVPSPVSVPAVDHAVQLPDNNEVETPRTSSPPPWMDRPNQMTERK